MDRLEAQNVEKSITARMKNCPCCNAAGICEFLYHHLDIDHFYVGCSNKDCGVNVDKFQYPALIGKTITDEIKEWTYETKIRTPEEMLEIWNNRV